MFLKKYRDYTIYGKDLNFLNKEEISFPSVFLYKNEGKNNLYKVITKKTIDKCENIECFKKIIQRKLDEFNDELKFEEIKKEKDLIEHTEHTIDINKNEKDQIKFKKDTENDGTEIPNWKTRKEIKQRIKNKIKN